VQPAEDVLAALEGSDIVPGMRAGGFHGNFERVSQFLERDTNGMQPLREIERAGLERRMFQQGRTMRQPRLDSPAPAARRLLVVTQISRDLTELVRDAAQFAGWQLAEQAISSINDARTSSSRTTPSRSVTFRSRRPRRRATPGSSSSTGRISRRRRDATRVRWSARTSPSARPCNIRVNRSSRVLSRS
jgi:hypothetical protein